VQYSVYTLYCDIADECQLSGSQINRIPECATRHERSRDKADHIKVIVPGHPKNIAGIQV
jgi:hypothetical protein